MLLFFALACDDSTVDTVATCPLGVPTLSATTAAPGDEIRVTLSPLTESWDTAVTVGSTQATVSGLERDNCDDCDDCRDTGGCTACSECTDCDTTCDDCLETLTFIVPDVAAGSWPVTIINSHGRSDPITLVVTATKKKDTGGADTGTSTP
jgi:hypothetical protein